MRYFHSIKAAISTPMVKRVAVSLVLVGLLLALSLNDFVHQRLLQVVVWIQGMIDQRTALGMPLFVLLSALSAMLAFFSTAVVVPAALRAWGQGTTVFLLWLGWFLGGMLSYLVGRYPGRKLLSWLVPTENTYGFEKGLTEKATFPLVLLFQMAVPSEVPGYVLGAMRYRMDYYLLALGIGELPFAAGTVYLGDSFMRREYLWLVLLGVGGVALSGAAMYTLQKTLKHK